MTDFASAVPPSVPSTTMAQPAVPRLRRMIPKCTHHSVTRVWDEYGCLRCCECHKPAQMGFMYRCTQETDLNLPDSDFVDVDYLNRHEIDSGRPTTANSSVNTGSFTHSFPTTTSITTNASIEPLAFLDMVSRFNWERSVLQTIRAQEAAAIGERLPTISACEYMVCPACKPVFRDRAWQSVDAVVNNALPSPSQFEFGNRPFSDARALVNMNYIRKRLSSDEQNKLKKTRRSQGSSIDTDGSSKDGDGQAWRPNSSLAKYTNLVDLAKATRQLSLGDSTTATSAREGESSTANQSHTNGTNGDESTFTSNASTHLEPVDDAANRPIRSQFGRSFRDSISDLLRSRNRASLLNSNALYNRPAENRSTSLVIDDENRERRMGRKPIRGRFYIEGESEA